MSQVPLSAFYGIIVYNGTSSVSAAQPGSNILSASSNEYYPVTGYTLATPFQCSLASDLKYTEAAITGSYNLIWWFGDGTYSTEFSPIHTYEWPGQYEIKVGLFNNNPGSLAIRNAPANVVDDLEVNISNQNYILQTYGLQTTTFSLTAAVNNYVQDSLSWIYNVDNYYNKNWQDIMVGNVESGACFYGYQSCKSGVASSGPVPLTFEYYTNILNNDDIKFNFYAHNSLSQPWTEAPAGQLTNLRPRWRFTTVSASPIDDGAIITDAGFTPVSSTEIRILSNGTQDPTGALVGLYGQVSFYYIDDMPSTVVKSTSALSLSANPTTIWATLDTSSIFNLQDYNYNAGPSYSNSTILLSSYYYVKPLTPSKINTTLNGVIPFYIDYWPRVESRFVNTFSSNSLTGTAEFLSEKNLLNFPLNLINNPFLSAGCGTFVVSYSGQNSNGTTIIAPSATFNLTDSPATGNYLQYTVSNTDSLGRNTGGAYIGTFTPYTSAYNGVLYTQSISGITYTSDLTPDSTTGYNPYYIDTTTYSLHTNTLLKGYSSTFSVKNFNNTYFARKFGGGFDYAAQLKASALQPTIAQNEVLLDYYFPAVAGVSATNEDTFGGVLFEKIANYVANTSDPATSNLNQFYSLADSLGIYLDNYNYENMPPALKRVVDLYSVQQSHIWGARAYSARDFSLSAGLINFTTPIKEYNIDVALVSAGLKIIVNDKFNSNRYELLEVPAITSYDSITARDLPFTHWGSPVSSLTYPLTTYPLSAFFAWGLSTPVSDFYRFFVYNDQTVSQQKEGLVNWEDPLTTLSEQASAHIDWVKDEGILESIFNYYIHKGLKLIK